VYKNKGENLKKETPRINALKTAQIATQFTCRNNSISTASSCSFTLKKRLDKYKGENLMKETPSKRKISLKQDNDSTSQREKMSKYLTEVKR